MGGAFSFAQGGPQARGRELPGAAPPFPLRSGIPSPRSRRERLRGLRRNSIAAYFSYGILLRVLAVRVLLAAIIGHLR